MDVGRVPPDTGDEREQLLDQLHELVPGAFPDGVLDPEALLAALGISDAGSASFNFTWPGIEQARAEARASTTATLVPDPEKSLNWKTARDILIEGDNLQVLKLLKSGYTNRAKVVYIDPPYNTGESFTYRDDYAVPESEYLKTTGQVDEYGNATTSRLESTGRKHAPWLNMMMPRLAVARNLLRSDGVILVSIDDNEVHHLRLLLDAVFGARNFVAQLVWKSKSGGANDAEYIATDHEYIMVYARDRNNLEIGLDPEAEVSTTYSQEDEHGRYSLERLDKQSIRYSESMDFEIEGPDGRKYRPAHKNPEQPNATWRWSRTSVQERYDELVFKDGYVYTKNYQRAGAVPRSLLIDERFGRTRSGSSELRRLFGASLFDNPKPTRLLQHLVAVFADGNDDLVLDFFAGSASIGHAVWLQNAKEEKRRRCVMVQAPEEPDESEQSGKNAIDAGYETIFELAADRLRRAAEVVGEGGAESSELGFRVFRAAPTNLVVEPPIVATDDMSGEDYVQSSLARTEGAPIVGGADAYAVAWEVALKTSATQLDAQVETHEIDGVTVFEFSPADETEESARLFVSLDAFDLTTADKLALSEDDTLLLRSDKVSDATTLTLASRLQSRLVLLERVPREVSL